MASGRAAMLFGRRSATTTGKRSTRSAAVSDTWLMSFIAERC
jgi:hypothetical protein